VPSCLAKLSWCDRKCRFPTWGGLHRSSKGVASTAALSFPPWCHVDKSTSASSTRSRVAALAYLDKQPGVLTNHSTVHKRSLNQRRKVSKQCKLLKPVKISKSALTTIQCFSLDCIKNTIVVCDNLQFKLLMISTSFKYPMEIFGLLI
jgi:hypothetical protein